MWNDPPPSALPRIVAVGFHRLKDMLHALAPSYRDVARVEVLDRGFDDAVEAVRDMQRTAPIDVLVAAGSNGAYLRGHVDLPVALVRVGGFDLLQALTRARRISARVGLVTHGEPPAEIGEFDALFGLGLRQMAYRTEQEARDAVRAMRTAGVEVVVAPGLVADLAEAEGMKGVFLYSSQAVREALDDAVELARASRRQQARRERLNTVLAQLRDGVVAVDTDERIEAVNPAMARLLGEDPARLAGRRLGEVAPALSLARTLRDGRAELDVIETVGAATVVASRVPIVEQGRRTGAVLTCQDPGMIQRLERDLRTRRPSRGARYQLADILGGSAAMVRLRDHAARVARGDATVLIHGESGTGKELLAQGIHAASRRARQPFVALNCAAFPESLLESELFGYEDGAFSGARRGGKAGLFEAAHTGTIFLDEIGEMPLPLQTRLLRVLQEREVHRIGALEPVPVDLRVIAATHRDLAAEVAQGRFRADLYYRLNILRLEIPPLRQRREDLPLLVDHLLSKIARRQAGAAAPPRDAVDALLRLGADYDWPGNVRELENLVERIAGAAVETPEPGAGTAGAAQDLLGELLPELMPGRGVSGQATAPAGARTDAHPGALTDARAGGQVEADQAGHPALAAVRPETERERILRVLRACGGSRTEASRALGIGRSTLWRRLREYGIEPGR